MYRRYIASVTALIGAIHSVHSSACLEEQVVIQHQPVVLICSGKSTTTTKVETSTSCASFTKPSDVTSTVVDLCTAATSCPPVTNTPPADCTHPCTTTVTTYTPPGTTPPDVTSTVVDLCTATTSCPPVTIPPPPDCTRPCTTTISIYTPPNPTPTPPDITISIRGTCKATTLCPPITVPPPPDCTHPCTTTVIYFPPTPTPSLPSSSTPSPTTPSSSSSSTPTSSPTTSSPSSSSTPSLTSSPSSSSTPSPTTPSSSSSSTPTSSPTTSSSSSSSTTSQCAKPTCSTGIKRARYPDPFGNGSGFNQRFNTTYFKQTKPQNQTIVGSFSDIGDAVDNYVSYEYAAFVYSCQGGSFTFNITNADDIGLAWFGSYACGDFQKNNNETSSSYEGGPGQGKSFQVDLAPEQYYPIRLIYVNAAGPANLTLKVTGPQGDVEGNNGYNFYPAACGSSNSFIDFGSEAQEGKSCTGS